MARGFNYGTKFNNSTASTRYAYDEEIAKDMRADALRMQAMRANLPQYKQELMTHKSAATNAKRMLAKTAQAKADRLLAEQHMLDAVKAAVSMLEFNMEELHRTRKIGTQAGLVNQHAIHNVLVHLRTKCGVSFASNPEYDHVVHAEVHRTAEQRMDEMRADREEQRKARLRNNREIAERFAAMHNAMKAPNG